MKKLNDFIKAVLEEAKKDGVNVKTSPTIDKRVYIFYNPDTNKAVTIGSKPSPSGEDSLRAYWVNVKKWVWAEDEGFTRDQIVTELAKDIFKRIDLEKVLLYLK